MPGYSARSYALVWAYVLNQGTAYDANVRALAKALGFEVRVVREMLRDLVAAGHVVRARSHGHVHWQVPSTSPLRGAYGTFCSEFRDGTRGSVLEPQPARVSAWDRLIQDE